MIMLLPALALLAAAQPEPPAPPPAPPAAASEEEGTRVVRGTPAAPGSAPWQIQVFTTIPVDPADLAADRALPNSDPKKRFYDRMPPAELDHVCGGALIADGWALTAAHCFVNSKDVAKPLESRRVRLGNVRLPAATEMAIERIIIHGDYRRAGDKRNDIALIRLVPDAKTDPQIAAFARPVRRLASTMRPASVGDDVKVTGWGITGENEPGESRSVEGKPLRGSQDLLEGDLKIVEPGRCKAIPGLRRTMWDGVLCVGGDKTAQDACQGDSGGPLTRQRILVGLVSSGVGCGMAGVPALYTRVAAYDDWVRLAMAGAPAGAVSRCRLNGSGPAARLECRPA